VPADAFVITVSVERLDDSSFDNVLLRQLSALYRRLRDEALPLLASEVRLDLRAMRALFPYAALGLLVLLQGLAPIFQQRIQVLLPSYAQAPDCVRWIAESGFLEAARPWADVHCDVRGMVRDDVYLVPIRVVATRQDHVALVNELLEKVPFLLGSALDQESCFRVITVFSELCQNILAYARPGVAAPGYAILQAFRGTVKFAIADGGPGIPATLRQKYEEALAESDDSVAIGFALQPEVTSWPDGGGLGLYHLREVIRRHNGILNIRSGRGKLLLSRGTEYLYQPRGLYRTPMYFWGTQIGVLMDRA
jgi:signal transduction histidine kinase